MWRTVAYTAVAAISLSLPIASPQTADPAFGAIQDGRYYHVRTAISFSVPAGWTVFAAGPSSDGGEMVTLRDSVTGSSLSVWMIVAKSSQEGIAAVGPADWYRHVVGMKIRQRYDQGLRDYWVAADTIQKRTVGGRNALAARGEFTEGSQLFAECLTWVVGEKARVFFFARTPKSNLDLVQLRFDELVATALIP